MEDKDYKEIEKEIQEDKRIDLFLQGKMEVAEEQAFLTELKQNEDLRQRALIQARLVKGMKQAEEEDVEMLRKAQKEDVEKVINGRREVPFARWMAYAASIVFIVFIGFKSYDYYSTVNLGKQYATAFPLSQIIRGEENNDVETELTTLFNKIIEAEDLDNTTAHLDSLWQLSKREVYNEYTDYAPYIGWNLAVGYLENYEKGKAKIVLKKMIKSYPEGTIVGDKIMEILNRL